MQAKIRQLNINDFDQIRDLILEFHQENVSEFTEGVNIELVTENFGALTKTSFVLLDDKEEKIVGLLAGLITQVMGSSKVVYQEIIWYVKKEYRKNGIKLIYYLEEFCKQHQINKIVMSSMINDVHDKVAKLYSKLGYIPFEIHYIKDV